MTGFIQVVTTTAQKEEAERIADVLLEQRLAACVQIVGPITSRYRWQGAIETAQEWLCIIKSREELFPALAQAIAQNHPYEVPEILATPVVAGGERYLSWLRDETRDR